MANMSNYRFDSKLGYISKDIEQSISSLYDLMEQLDERSEEYDNLLDAVMRLKEIYDYLGGCYRN